MKRDNRGFSLVELIVVMAIMSVMIGMVTYSLSFLLGKDASQAAKKIAAQINETRTGAMSRYDENMTLLYLAKDEAHAISADGYYAKRQTWTLQNKETEAEMRKYIGQENRKVSSTRVQITALFEDGSNLVLNDSNSLLFSFDRTSGAMKPVELQDGSKKVIQSLVIEAGRKTKTITFTQETGKLVIE